MIERFASENKNHRIWGIELLFHSQILMLHKIYMAIFCLFLTCTPESSEAGKFVEITNQSEQSYVEPKAYKETKSNPDSCRVKHYKENISGT